MVHIELQSWFFIVFASAYLLSAAEEKPRQTTGF